MSEPLDRDHDLERLLGEDGGDLGALYRRLPRMEPPRRLDRTVLGEAARAVRGRPPRRQRWMVGFCSAAGVVLAAGIAWHVGQDALHRQAQSPGATGVVPVEPIIQSAPRPREHANPSGAPPAAVVPAPRRHDRPAQAPAPVATPVPFPAERTTTIDNAPTSAPAPTAQHASTREAPERAQEADRDAAKTSTATAAAPREAQLAPDAWFAQIRALLRAGQREQARERLRQFRLAHPQQRLPEDLRALGG